MPKKKQPTPASLSAGDAPLATFDFALLSNPEFKEDSVREEIIAPLLTALGYSANEPFKITRSKKLTHPFVSMGSKQQKITHFPDYLLYVNGVPALTLDAKSPQENILNGKNVEQVYFYAIHPDVRTQRFALCNGHEFVLFALTQKEPILHVHLSELGKHWGILVEQLRPDAFSSRPIEVFATAEAVPNFDYLSLCPPKEISGFQKQAAKRHFGVHGYFTRQVYSVVQAYIKNFTQPGDIVLDPFGGSGVTFIEALLLGRRAIHIDLNPLSVFIVSTFVAPIDTAALGKAFEAVTQEFELKRPKSDVEAAQLLKVLPYPKNIALPRNSDVTTVDQLFSTTQLAELALLKKIILKVKVPSIKDTLLLMFSGLLNKINLTYHASSTKTEGQGDGSVFRYYRYRIAPEPVFLNPAKYFESRLKRIVAAKNEIAPLITQQLLTESIIRKGTATDLSWINAETIDYIYTDPPYGSKIAYLDLSTMWNAWLDLPVTEHDIAQEAIEGGEAKKSKSEYSSLLGQSIQEMYRVLKFNRWMSFVFAHKDPAYWHLIVDTAEKTGFEYAGAVKQNNGQATFKKTQNPFTVLSGQLIINFKKVRNPKSIMKVSLGADITDVILETIEAVIAQFDGATLEQINDELVMKGLELGFLEILSREYQDVTPLLTTKFDFDDRTKRFHLPQNTKFKSRIDIQLRIKYFLVAYMRRMNMQRISPTFDDIVLAIMPLLKNGTTPENQTILSVLGQVAEQVGNGRWRLTESGQSELFN